MPRDGSLPPKEKRDFWLPKIRVSEAERARVEQQAEAAGLSLSAYARQALLHGAVIVRHSAVDPEAVRQLAAIGNNLNQLTRKTHIHDEYDRSRLHDILRRIGAWIDKAI